MPCITDHMEPTQIEIGHSRVLCLLDELQGIQFSKQEWNGYHKQAYNKHIVNYDNATALLCEKLKTVEDITQYSLEMQMWWRDHQQADEKREKEEKRKIDEADKKEIALSKLTGEERRLLGL